MKNVNRKFTDTEIRVNATAAFPSLFAPKAPKDGNGKPKYELCVVVDKNDEQAVQLVNEAVEAAKALYTEQFGKPKGKLKTWISDGDEERPDDPFFAGKLYFTAKADRKPELKIVENGMLVDPLDETEIYGGCRGGALVRFYPYNNAGGSGIACGLNGFVKLEDGPRMGGGASANAFDDLV